jgi:hypothetical protein
MDKYRYYIDRKQIIWSRDHYCIEAESEEEANLKLKEIFEGNEDLDYECIIVRDTLYDTAVDLEVSLENPVTLEAFTEEGELLFDNQLRNLNYENGKSEN